jgi:hypothetical protein
MEQLYINQLSDMEKKVLKIAQDHLETSFSLKKSIGFKKWYALQIHEVEKPVEKTETITIIRKRNKSTGLNRRD